MSRFLRILAAASAAVFFCSAAQSQTLLSGFVSRHMSGDYNENNYGIGIRIDDGRWSGWAIGTYRNSIDRQSVYIGREWTWHVAGPVHIGALAGAATGYRTPIMPLALPELVVRFKRIEAAFLWQPIDSKNATGFVALQLRWKF